MSDHVSHVGLASTTLNQDSDSSHQLNSSTKFKFWSNNFDDLKYIYDHMNVTKDVEKVKTIGAQQLTQNIKAY